MFLVLTPVLCKIMFTAPADSLALFQTNDKHIQSGQIYWRKNQKFQKFFKHIKY